MATHPDLKRAMERDGVPTLVAVEEATGMAHRTLHRYRQEDESDYVQSSRRVDLWVMGYQRMVQSDGRWTLAPGPGPAATDGTWNNLREIEAYLLARAEELVQRERVLAAREAQVVALRGILGREAGGDWEAPGATCFQSGSEQGNQEIDIDGTETGLQGPEGGGTPKSMNVSIILELAARAQGPRAKKGAGPRKTPFTTYLPPSTRTKLDAASARYGASLGDLVVGALEATLPEAEEAV